MAKEKDDLLEQVRSLLSHKEDIKAEFHREILKLGRNVDKKLLIRDIFHPILYITEKKDIRYYDPVLEPIKNTLYKAQIYPKETLEVLTNMGKTPKRENFIKIHAGAYPTEIVNGELIVYREKPEIDSTSIATTILLEIGLLTKSDIEKNVIPRVKKSLKYLFNQEFKITGLLYQGKGEDWAPKAGREGIVTYSNIIYLILLEKAINLFISYGEKSTVDIIREKMSKLVDAINKHLWYNHYYINGITTHGASDLTYILDTIYLGLTKTYEQDNRLKTHIKTLARTLTTEEGLLRLNAPLNYNDHVSKINPHEDVNGGIWIHLNILYAYTLINNHDIPNGVKLLNKLLEYRDYIWIDSKELKKGVKGGALTNTSLILKSMEKIENILQKEKLIEKL